MKLNTNKTSLQTAEDERELTLVCFSVIWLIFLMQHMTEETERGYQALYTMNQMINMIDLDDRATYSK